MLARFLASQKICPRTLSLTCSSVKQGTNLRQRSHSSTSSAPPEALWVNRWGDQNRVKGEKTKTEMTTPLRFDGRVAIVTGAGGGEDIITIIIIIIIIIPPPSANDIQD